MEIDQWINEYNEFLLEISRAPPYRDVTMSDKEWKPIKKRLMKIPREKWLMEASGSDHVSFFQDNLHRMTILIKSLKYDVTSPKAYLKAIDELVEIHEARVNELLNTDSRHERIRKLGVWLAYDMMNIASYLAHMAASHFDDNEDLQNSLMLFYDLIPLEAL